jgi:hypothetical protein
MYHENDFKNKENDFSGVEIVFIIKQYFHDKCGGHLAAV